MGARNRRKVSSYLPTTPTLAADLSERAGRPVLRIEALPVAAGEALEIEFVSAASPHQQGIWLAVDGELEVAGVRQSQFVLWKETAPPIVAVRVVRAEPPCMWLYNEYHNGRQGISQMALMGMLKEDGPVEATYRCNDRDEALRFNALVFKVRRRPSSPSA